MYYSSHFKDTLTLENKSFFKKMEILIFWVHSKVRASGKVRDAVEKSH